MRVHDSHERFVRHSFPFGPVASLLMGDNDSRIADELGVERRTIVRWRKHGVPECRADGVAVRLGVHPSALWGERWWETA